MIGQNSYVTINASTEFTKLNARCYMAGIDGDVLKAALIAGPEQLCVGIFANLVQEGSLIFVDGKRVTKCEHRYRRLVAHLGSKWISMLILSKDPCCLWQDDDLGLIAGVKKVTETPLLDSWIGYIREELTKGGHLKKLSGHNAIGSIIKCATQITDGIVHQGITQGQLLLRGE